MINYNPFSLEGKTILVTGASSGIGRATAIECSKMGATVILTARNEERLNETLSMMEGEGHTVIPADLCIEEEVKQLVSVVPPIDGVAYIAGIGSTDLVKFYNKEKLQNVFGANVVSCVSLNTLLIKKKKINNKASLVFMSSIASKNYAPANGIYSMSKSAIEVYAKQCALELMPKQIRSNAILPGMINTPLIDEACVNSFPATYQEDISKYIRGEYGKPKDVALMVVYLLSDASAFVTGSSFVIDGGRFNLIH